MIIKLGEKWTFALNFASMQNIIPSSCYINLYYITSKTFQHTWLRSHLFPYNQKNWYNDPNNGSDPVI